MKHDEEMHLLLLRSLSLSYYREYRYFSNTESTGVPLLSKGAGRVAMGR
jgi:hypothetical protein